MPVSILTSPPRLVFDTSDMHGNGTTFSYTSAGQFVATSQQQLQRFHQFGLDYAVRNGTASNLASGSIDQSRAILAGGFTHAGWSDEDTNINYDGSGTILDPSRNIFESVEMTYTSRTHALTMSGSSHDFLSPHSFTFTEYRVTEVVVTLREAILADLVSLYPAGTLTFLVSTSGSQNENWDVHVGYAITDILATDIISTPEFTYNLTDFGVAPTGGWTLGDVTGGTWDRNCVSGGTFTRSCISGGTWAQQEVTNG